jgi:hypothetical protein
MRRGFTRIAMKRLMTVGGLALGAWFAVVAIVYGGGSLLPRQVAYNVFICSNPLSKQTILRDYSCEPALAPALDLARARYDLSAVQTFDQAEAMFFRLASDYLAEHPVRGAELAALKIYNLFRIDQRVLDRSQGLAKLARGIILVAIALLPALWSGMRLLAWRTNLRAPLPILLLGLAYVVPIALAQTEVRLRLPLDVLMIIDLLVVGSLLWQRPSGSDESLSGQARARRAEPAA